MTRKHYKLLAQAFARIRTRMDDEEVWSKDAHNLVDEPAGGTDMNANIEHGINVLIPDYMQGGVARP